MHLLYICANQLREIIPVDGGAFYQAAQSGTFDVEVRDMVLETTAAIQHHGHGRMATKRHPCGVSHSRDLHSSA